MPAAVRSTRPGDGFVGLRTAYFDLETTDLKGNFGRLLCGSIADEWGNVVTHDRTQFKARTKIDDRDLALTIRDALEQFDIIVGWNSKLFDVPFLNARLSRAGERPLNLGIKHIDLMWYATGRFIRAGSRRLENIAKFFNCENQKTPLVAETWALAAAGDDDALGGIIEHCEADVLVLRDVFDHLKGYIPGVHR